MNLIQMAREAGFTIPVPGDGYMGLAYDYRERGETGGNLERFAKLVAEHEREECAKVCDDIYTHSIEDWEGANQCGDAIRARGQT